MSHVDLAYPIGRFEAPAAIDRGAREVFISQIAAAPGLLRKAVGGLDERQLETPYRPGGWTVRQVVHHLPDSHINAYVRFKLALTENVPTIKPYEEGAWARLKDTEQTPIEVSLTLLDALHQRWVILLKSMKPEEFLRKLNHPESGVQDLDRVLALYSWHGNHHLGHITGLRERMKW